MAGSRVPRREPRVGVFIGTGALIGLVLGLAAAMSTPDNAGYSASAAFGYLAVFGLLLGAIVGGVAAALLAGRG